jgi:alpha-galactosidase
MSLSIGMVAVIVGSVYASSPNLTEFAERDQWVSAKINGIIERGSPKANLVVLANNDAVQKNSRGGKSLKIADKEYHRGLYCHAISKIVVNLPSPAKTFSAIIGIDSNDQTMPGRGSVIFSVNSKEKELYRSQVIIEGMKGIPIEVDLNGATQFMLEVGDAGDGISCDQSDWAEAKVTLADGAVIWLGDLPIEGQQKSPYTTDPPFSFVYDGKPSAEFLSSWKVERQSINIDNNREEHKVIYTDPNTGLEIRCVAIEYSDFPTVEWTIYFKNNGSKDTPIISDIQAIDTVLERDAQGEFVLNHHDGSPCMPYDYRPHKTELKAGAEKIIATSGGRSSNSDFPYFNVELPGEGYIIVIGWAGQWSAKFSRDSLNKLRVQAGQELTHFKLYPNEEIRTPLIVVQFWKGDRIDSQNTWRKWMTKHNLPNPPTHQLAACSSHQYAEMINANEDNQKMFVDRYLEEGVQLDYWWMDAGWYINETGWPNTGTWEIDTKRFPNGLKAITDHAHSKGVNIIVWFEPERVTPGTWLYENHPEWLLGMTLLDLGNSEARQWLTDHVDKLIKEQGIDLYRNDFNMDPLSFWRKNDAEDRQGITEIRYVEGFLEYWSELRRRNPGMLIDTCASGGRRNDLETLRRSVPLLRSDYIFEPVSQQCHTYGIAQWIPFYGTGVIKTDSYTFRSNMCPHVTACWDMRNKDLDYDSIRKLVNQWKEIGHYYIGDFYPLTPYSLENDVWMAWQFNRPDIGEGMVQAFRRADSFYESARFKLNDLDPDANYTIENLDIPDKISMSGQELMEKGLPIAIVDQPGAVVIVYKKK